ncbi:MAG TPA: hypothetical protein VIW45_12300 [Vicinamibacterales bacterium]|jgi:hypothetical protein
MKTVAMTLFALCAAAAAGAQSNPTRQEINEAAKKIKTEQAAAELVALEKAKAADAAKGTATPSTARVRQPINIKMEFTLTDQRGTGAPSKRVVSAMVADGGFGQIRSSSDVVGVGGGVTLNIDANPEILPDGKIKLVFSLVYDWPGGEVAERPARGTVMKTSMHDSVSLILENGKPMIAAQSADPVVDRQVTVEVKATVLR